MTHQEQLENPKYRNWVKGVLSLKYLKDGIEEFADKVVQSEHHRILTQTGATSEKKCQNCTLVNLKPLHKSTTHPSTGKKTCSKGQRNCNCLGQNKKKCKANICDKIYEQILESHASSPPSPCWKNTDISKWTTHPWQIGKCYINAPGYADVENAKDIDVAGLLHIFINNINFQEHMSPPQRDLPSKTLQTRNSIFHSPSMELETQELDTCIRDIIAILQDDKELKDIDSAKQAIVNIRKLKDQNFIITTQTETEVCKLAMLSIAQEREELRKVIQETKKDIASKQDMTKLEETVASKQDLIKLEKKVASKQDLKKIEDTVASKQDLTKLEETVVSKQDLTKLEETVASKQDLTEIEEKVALQKQDLTKLEETNLTLKKRIQEIEDRTKQRDPSEVQQKIKDIIPDLQEDLITYYRANESSIPAAPLVESQHVPLLKLYVRPPMRIVKEHPVNNDTKMQTAINERPITSYRRLFFRNNGVPFRNIYVTANAGMGKTSFSQHLTMTWCQAHSPEESLCKPFEEDDISVMKQFEICFLIHLRDYHDCNTDDLVCEFLSRHISGQYSRHSVEDLLHEKYCLLILDGLDEWSHPVTCPRRNEGIPHRKTRKRCTMLTTTRPWKLSTAALPSTQIDYHVEISALDKDSSEKLDKRAVKLLNSRRQKGEEPKNIADLKYKFFLDKLGNLRFIPYIKLQAICLWFDGKQIGKSKCEIYSNVVEFTLARGLKKADLPHIQTSNQAMPYEIPKCMANNRLCISHIYLLNKLGKVAFSALFHEMKESTLVIERETALAYLENDELEFLLKIGLLSQSKDSSLIARECHKVFFQHKSVQEFFSALYISLESQNEMTKKTLLKVDRSLIDILEMSNVFVFVSGMNQEAYSEIESTLKSTVANDNDTISYRRLLNNNYGKLTDFQSMQLACLEEQLDNNHLKCSVSLQDIFISKVTNTQLQLINIDNLVSITLFGLREVFFEKDTDIFPSLETLRVSYCNKVSLINHILAASANTLKYLNLRNIIINVDCERFVSTLVRKPLSCLRPLLYQNINLGALTSLACLLYVDIECLKFPHNDMIKLFRSLENWRTVTCLKLENITCSDHSFRCTGVTLDISHLEKLQLLHVSELFFNKVLLNTKSLVELELNSYFYPSLLYMSHSSIQQLFNSIGEGKSLKKLFVNNITCLDHPKLPFDCSGAMLDLSGVNNLRKLKLDWIPMCGLSWSSDALTICDIGFSSLNTNTYLVLTHTNIQPLYSSIANCRKLTYIRIYHIKCLEHKSCCRDSYLDLSQHSKLETLDLKNIPLSDFLVNTEALVTCYIDCSKQPQCISSKSMQHFFSSIGIGNKVTTLKLSNILAGKDPYSACILDLSRIECLEYLYLQAIPLNDIILNTCALLTCWITSSSLIELIEMPHKAIQQFFSSIANGRQLENIDLENIICSDHYHCNESCNIYLDLSHISSLNTVNLRNISLSPILTSQSVPSLNDKPYSVVSTTSSLHELRTIRLAGINFDENALLLSSEMISLREVHLKNCTMTSSSWNKLFQSIVKLKLKLNSISVHLANVTISASGCRELLQSIGKIQGSNVSVTLTDTCIRMSAQKNIFIKRIYCKPQSIAITPQGPILALREIVTFFICLPQSLIVRFYNTRMTNSHWRELLHNTFHKLSQSITVKIAFCTGLTWEEWNCIVDEIKVSDAFIIEKELINWKEKISFTFLTVESTQL